MGDALHVLFFPPTTLLTRTAPPLPLRPAGNGNPPIRRPTIVSRLLKPQPHISQAGFLSEDLVWHLSQSFPYTTLDVAVSPTIQSSGGVAYMQRTTLSEVEDASASLHKHPPTPSGGSGLSNDSSSLANTSLGDGHSDLTAVSAAAAASMVTKDIIRKSA